MNKYILPAFDAPFQDGVDVIVRAAAGLSTLQQSRDLREALCDHATMHLCVSWAEVRVMRMQGNHKR